MYCYNNEPIKRNELGTRDICGGSGSTGAEEMAGVQIRFFCRMKIEEPVEEDNIKASDDERESGLFQAVVSSLAEVRK